MDKFQNADWIAASSAVIALCAMAATFWQGKIARTHSRLSVRPHLDSSFSAEFETRIKITVINSGLGPGIINSLKFHDPKSNENYSPNELRHLLLSQIDASTVIHEAVSLSGASSLAPNKDLMILSFEQKNKSSKELQKLYHRLRDFLMIIEYECMYGMRYLHKQTINAA